jgi:hypothetical protein
VHLRSLSLSANPGFVNGRGVDIEHLREAARGGVCPPMHGSANEFENKAMWHTNTMFYGGHLSKWYVLTAIIVSNRLIVQTELSLIAATDLNSGADFIFPLLGLPIYLDPAPNSLTLTQLYPSLHFLTPLFGRVKNKFPIIGQAVIPLLLNGKTSSFSQRSHINTLVTHTSLKSHFYCHKILK